MRDGPLAALFKATERQETGDLPAEDEDDTAVRLAAPRGLVSRWALPLAPGWRWPAPYR